MPESPSSSFIPKRGVGKKPTVVRKSNFVLLSIISYALFVSAPLASAAVFIYERHTQNQFNKAVVSLDEAIANFNEEDLKRVTAFNERMLITQKLMAGHVSIDTLLTTIEAATAQTVKFKDMDINRIGAGPLTVSGLLTTDKFDGALFQRASYNGADTLTSPAFTDVKLVEPPADDSSSSVTGKKVEFKATFTVSSDAVMYKPFPSVLTQETPEVNQGDNETPNSPEVSDGLSNEDDI